MKFGRFLGCLTLAIIAAVFPAFGLELSTAACQGLARCVIAQTPDQAEPTAAAERLAASPALPETEAHIVARVGDKVIRRDRFDDVAAWRIERLKGTVYSPDAMDEQRRNLLNYLVDGKLMVILAQRDEIEVSEKEVQEGIAKTKAEHPSEDELKQFLKTIGTTIDEYPAFVREMIMIGKWLEKLQESIVVTGEEIAAEYETLKEKGVLMVPPRADIRHIFMRADGDDPEKWAQAEKRIKGARARVLAGEDFAEVATEVSEDQLSKSRGGAIENVLKGMWQPEFDKAVFELAIGEVSEPVKTTDGWHIVTVMARHESEPMPLQAVTTTIKDAILQSRKDTLMRKSLEEARGTVKIETFLPPCQEPARPVAKQQAETATTPPTPAPQTQ